MMEISDLHERFIQLSKPLEPQGTNTLPVLQYLEDIKVIAYDFYGTLFISGVGDIGIDNGKADEDLLIETLKNSGIEILDDSAGSAGFDRYNKVVKKYISDLKKNGIEFPEPDIRSIWGDVLTYMRRRGLIQYDEDNSIQNIVSVEFEARMNPVWPMPDAADTLKYFKKKGAIQGIISNSQFYTPVVLEALMNNTLEDLGFEKKLLHWSFDEKMKKPDMQFFKNFIKKLIAFDKGLSPSNVLYVGNDMLKDVYPAHRIGMKTALFAGDRRSLKWRKEDERCKDIQPDLIITSLTQLCSCLEL